MRIDEIHKSFPFHFFVGVLLGKKAVVEANLGINGVRGGHPMQSGLDFATVRSISALDGRIVGAVEFNHFSGGRVFDHLGAGDKVCIAQANLPARSQAEVLFGRVLHKVLLLNVKHL